MGRSPTAGRTNPPRSGGGTVTRPTGSTRGRSSTQTVRAPNGHNVKINPTVNRGGRTITQRAVTHNHETMIQRTSVRRFGGHNVSRDRFFRFHDFHGFHFFVFAPFWAFDLAFWDFYFAPFGAPWFYTWPWVSAPWYAAWGWYYTPYPYYLDASYWVTDYVVSDMLSDQYEQGYNSGEAKGIAISESNRDQLRTEVEACSRDLKAGQAPVIDTALQTPGYLFAVDSSYDAVSVAEGTNCSLTTGDLIKVSQAPGVTDTSVLMEVVTAKNGSCAAGVQVRIALTDLQEMINGFSERVDDGLNDFKNHKGEVHPR